MDFQQLLAKMVELDQPTVETVAPTAAVEECGEPMSMTPPMGEQTPPPAHPSMSLNLNAQGMDNIESLMKLMTRVNPDMINQPEVPPMPTLSIAPPGPTMGPKEPSMADLRNKMLPDLDDKEPEDNKVDIIKVGDDDKEEKDEATDHRDAYQRDLDASQTGFEKPEREDDEDEDEKDEAFANSVNDSEPEVKSVDYMNNQLAGGMNKPKTMHKHSYKQGDNPMAMEGGDLRASIRAELQQRLAEAKGAK